MTARVTRDKAALMRLLEQERKKLNSSIQCFGPASQECLEASHRVDLLLEELLKYEMTGTQMMTDLS